MKIEPRKIKKTLKYATVGACVATSLISTGCEKEQPVLPGGAPPIEYTQPTAEVQLDGDIATTPMPTIKNLPNKVTPEPEDIILSGDIATTPTPELAGGIPAPFDYEDGDEEYELATSGTPPTE